METYSTAMRQPVVRVVLAAMIALSLAIVPLRPRPDAKLGLETSTGPAYAQTSLPPLPAGWPSTLQLGMGSPPGDASTMRATAPFGFRYQYLAGGANTGGGWATWNPGGQFATNYIQESIQQGIAPGFTYYMIRQSAPGNTVAEEAGVATNLQNTATMQAYFADLKLLFQRAGEFPGTRVLVHVEPDLWGYVQQRSTGDDAKTVAVKVGATGVAELTGLPDNAAGLARAIVRLRDTYAPNVWLGYHVSVWGTGVDISISDPPPAEVDALAARAASFYTSLGANFDLAVAEFSDRDSAFKQAQYGQGPEAWWDADDFGRHVRFLGRFVAATGKRMVLWQIPYGNTKMRAMNNSWGHYQDNRVEWLLDEPARTHLTAYVNAGAIGLLFGMGADGVTCPCDAVGDGVTNPAPINGNTATSLSADDDGGFFRDRARGYYAAGPIALPDGGSPGPPVQCSPRPPVAVDVAAESPGVLRATLTISGSGNGIRQLQFDPRNARIRVSGQPDRITGFTLIPQPSTATFTFRVLRVTPGASTVLLVVTDACGPWKTFVGGGPQAF